MNEYEIAYVKLLRLLFDIEIFRARTLLCRKLLSEILLVTCNDYICLVENALPIVKTMMKKC